MSSADLWEDNYPHGTPEGYDGGCKGGACPAGVAYGLSCKTAKSKSNGDVQYRRLVKAGNTVPEIADALGLIGSDPSSAPAAKAPAKKPTPKTVPKAAMSIADAAAALQMAARLNAAQPDAAIAADEKRKARVAALKAHVTAKVEQPTPVPTPPAVPAPKEPAPAPKTGEIRAWAKAKGYAVGDKGKLPQHIVDHYWEATGRLTPSTDTEQPSTDTEQPSTDTAAAGTDTTAPEADPTAGDVAIADPEITDATVFITAEIRDEPEASAEERPDWGTIAAHVDLEAARRWAVRFEQEYVHAAEQLVNVQKQLAKAQEEAIRIAEHYVEKINENVVQKARIADLVRLYESEQHLRRIAENATAFALTKWGEERAANEESHALIVGQAHTLNTLTDCLAAPRWITGVDVDPETFDITASRIMQVPQMQFYYPTIDTPVEAAAPDTVDEPVAQANAEEGEIVLGFDGANDSDTVAIAKKPRPWHRR